MLLVAVGLALSSSSVLAQKAAADFWKKSGEVQCDSAGNVIYREVKDPESFTVQVFDRGKTVTYHYAPNSLKIVRAEVDGVTDEYLYGADGDWEGLTVHLKTLPLTLRATRSGAVSTPGLPALSVTRDSLGRDATWSSDGILVGRIDYDTRGQVQRVALGNAMTLDMNASSQGLTEVLRSPDGIVASATIGERHSKREFRYSLDLAARQLGLGTDWSNNVKVSQNATGSLLTLTSLNGRVLAYLVSVGPVRAAFTAAGKPLFYDLPLNYTDRASPSIGGDIAIDLNVKLQGVLPDRILVAANGDTGFYIQRPADNAIQSFWISTTNGVRSYSHRMFNPAGKSPQSLREEPAWRGGPVAVANRLRPLPQMMYVCDESTVCTYSDGCPSCQSCTITMYYCDSPDGGGTYGGGYGGGGSSGSPSNQVTGDAILRARVSQGLSNATNKLANQQCLSVFSNLCDTNGTPLANVLTQKGYGAADWLNSGISIANGYTNGICSGASAWTTVGGMTVNICTSFSSLTSGEAGNRLIHEELHTLGYSENPPDPNFMTSGEITNYVAANCGS